MHRGVWVAGLRECTGLRLEGTHLTLVSDGGDCRVFRHGQSPAEIAPGADVQFLLDET